MDQRSAKRSGKSAKRSGKAAEPSGTAAEPSGTAAEPSGTAAEPIPAGAEPSGRAAESSPDRAERSGNAAASRGKLGERSGNAAESSSDGAEPSGKPADRGVDDGRGLVWIERIVFVAALAVLVAGAAGGPGWTAASGDAVLAAHFERSAGAPLYGLIAGAVVHLLPAGEPAFRLAACNAVLGALVLLGVMRAARALFPRDPLTGIVAAIVLLLAPPFREAAGIAGASMLAACGAVWAIALALRATQRPSTRSPSSAAAGDAPRCAVGAIACTGIVIGAAPWLGALLAILFVAWVARAHRNLVAASIGVLGIFVVIAWLGARGRLPALDPDLAAMIAASGRGAAGVVIGAGLLGAAFGALTGLAGARWLAAALAITAAHAIAFDHDPVALLAVFAIAGAIVVGAIVRVAAGAPQGLPRAEDARPRSAAGEHDRPPSVAWPAQRRHLVALVAGAPLVGVALLAGPAFAVEDAGDSPARLADDLVGALPPGPGLVVATRDPAWMAIQYAQSIAGARPDLALAPPGRVLDRDVVDALRSGRHAAADTQAFGRLDPRRALPRGRGFQLLGEPPATGAPVPPPARYRTAIGERAAIDLALARARYEGGYARLDLAARAAGLTDRFRAADLALLAVASPTPARPALFGFVPLLESAPGERWTIDLFGDDLAWVAGLPQPDVAQPAERALHALWRKLWLGQIKATDPAIIALGPRALAATLAMQRELGAL